MSSFEEELAWIQVGVYTEQKKLVADIAVMQKAINKAHHLAVVHENKMGATFKSMQQSIDTLADAFGNATNEFKLKEQRKERTIKKLQESLRKVIKSKDVVENQLKNIKSAEHTSAEMDQTSEITKLKAEIIKLKKERTALKDKCKAKGRRIRQYKLLLADIDEQQYEDDLDEADGEASDDSSGAEDIQMIDKKTLMDASDSDPSDSDYDPNAENDEQNGEECETEEEESAEAKSKDAARMKSEEYEMKEEDENL